MVPENYRNYDATKYRKEELRPFLKLTTPVVVDAMYGIHNLFQNSGKKMVGYAFTCRIQHGDWLWVCKACDAMDEGDVLIIDMGGTDSVACWGDLSNAGLMNRKGTGGGWRYPRYRRLAGHGGAHLLPSDSAQCRQSP